MQSNYEKLIEKHVKSLEWMRKEFLRMDSLIHPVMGIKDWDDSCCVKFGNKKLVVSVDGPYTKRLVLKSALIHASTDILVKGAKPLFALDTLIGSKKDVREMMKSLKYQALKMKIPILGGNTFFIGENEETEPRCSLTVIGELITKEPIRDRGAKRKDTIAILGEPIWGEQNERIKKAKVLFKTWYDILIKKIKINAAKDITKGGLISTIYEISEKSKRRYEIDNQKIQFSMTRNLDNFLISVDEKNFEKIKNICEKNKCGLWRIGNFI